MNGCVWQGPTQPHLHPIVPSPLFFLKIRKDGTDMWAVVTMILHGYANEHVKQKEKWYNNFIDNKYANK